MYNLLVKIKRFYILLIIIIFLLSVVFIIYQNKKTVFKGTEDKIPVVDISISPQAIRVGERESLLVGQRIAKTEGWDYKNSLLSLRDEHGKGEEIKLEPAKMKIMVPLKNTQKLTGMKVLNESNLDDLHWQTAFCEGDEVNIGTDENGEIIMVMNNGYRVCGFKGE